MENTFQIEETIGIPSILISYISKPHFYLDEDGGLYRATMKCYSIDEKFVCNKEVFFTQEEYDSWGSGDDGDIYIYNLIMEKLGFTKI